MEIIYVTLEPIIFLFSNVPPKTDIIQSVGRKKEFEKSHCKIINKSFFIKCIKDENELILEFKTFTMTFLSMRDKFSM